MNDLIRLAIERAVSGFGGDRKIFNAAGFSTELAAIARMSNSLDGEYVRAILCGRPDVEVLSGGSHYCLIATTNPTKPQGKEE